MVPSSVRAPTTKPRSTAGGSVVRPPPVAWGRVNSAISRARVAMRRTSAIIARPSSAL